MNRRLLSQLAAVSLLAVTGLVSERADAQSLAATPSGTIVAAHDGVIDLYSSDGAQRLWQARGVTFPGAIATSDDRIAVPDPLAGRVVVASQADGSTLSIDVEDTPIDALFDGENLFLLERDGRRLERIAPDGSRSALGTGAYPAFLRAADGKLYVYSRADGLLQEYTTRPFAAVRSVVTGPWASDFEVAGNFACFVYPAKGRIGFVSLQSFENAGEEKVGAVPVDLALAGGSTLLTAPLLAIADPGTRRVWTIEAPAPTATATGRGFLRGLLGMGLFAGRDAPAATGVDRVVAAAGTILGYDSASGTLFRVSARKSEKIASGLGPRAFVATPAGIFLWSGTLVAQKLN